MAGSNHNHDKAILEANDKKEKVCALYVYVQTEICAHVHVQLIYENFQMFILLNLPVTIRNIVLD